jgi:hypothetical protein
MLTRSRPGENYEQRVTITFSNGDVISETLEGPKGVGSSLSNEEILEKFRGFTEEVIDVERQNAIEKLVLELETLDDVSVLENLLGKRTLDPIA